MSLYYYLFYSIVAVLLTNNCILSFSTFVSTRKYVSSIRRTMTSLDTKDNVTPESKQTRLRINVEGPHVNNAVFRAELKKELTFFRGCPAVYTIASADSATILTEGKTAQLTKFLRWLEVLGTSMVSRKPNFQGPSLVIHIISKDWQEYKGDLRGFSVENDMLRSRDASQLVEDGSLEQRLIEVSSMMGTDESV